MAREQITNEQAEDCKRELAALRAMVEGPGWKKYFAPKLAEKERERLAGLSARGLTLEKRAEHIEGYHDAVELASWAEKRIEHLTAKVKEYER